MMEYRKLLLVMGVVLLLIIPCFNAKDRDLTPEEREALAQIPKDILGEVSDITDVDKQLGWKEGTAREYLSKGIDALMNKIEEGGEMRGILPRGVKGSFTSYLYKQSTKPKLKKASAKPAPTIEKQADTPETQKTIAPKLTGNRYIEVKNVDIEGITPGVKEGDDGRYKYIVAPRLDGDGSKLTLYRVVPITGKKSYVDEDFIIDNKNKPAPIRISIGSEDSKYDLEQSGQEHPVNGDILERLKLKNNLEITNLETEEGARIWCGDNDGPCYSIDVTDDQTKTETPYVYQEVKLTERVDKVPRGCALQ